ncbi:TnsA endonuclease N-terminal domain-containing protein [Brevibacillus laterosporus]|uniref:TnsA endonuclease N-terminal domain-containing protein n=1 Tax=Brevibacillus laterosporus TaxID=1465 RepID=UPI000839C0AA|nr:TnsA endonuclease N-terminal domain-containing protein [Brevibacillus laterosporus]
MSKARKIPPSKGKHHRGLEPSLKLESSTDWESSLERDYIKLLEFDQDIISYEHQPLVINYSNQGKAARYFPDFKIITKQHGTILIEVKPEKFINLEENRIKFAVGRMFCQKQGWEFQVKTELHIRPGFLQKNLTRLIKLQKSCLRSTELYLINNIKRNAPISIADLQSLCSDISEADLKGYIYHLIYKHEIHTNLVDFPLSDDSLLSC